MAGYIVRQDPDRPAMIFALTVITYAVFVTVPADPGVYLTGVRTNAGRS